MFYAVVNPYQNKTSELNNLEKLVEQTYQALMSCLVLEWTGNNMCIFVQSIILQLYIPERWSLKIKCGSWKVLEMSGLVLQKFFPIILQNHFKFMNHSVTISQMATQFSPKDLCLPCSILRVVNIRWRPGLSQATLRLSAAVNCQFVNHKCYVFPYLANTYP